MGSPTTMKMRLRPERWALLLGLASAAMWLAGAATLAAADWKREVGTEFPGAMRSVWTLESVAREGGDLVFAVSFRNGSRSTRSPISPTGNGVFSRLSRRTTIADCFSTSFGPTSSRSGTPC